MTALLVSGTDSMYEKAYKQLESAATSFYPADNVVELRAYGRSWDNFEVLRAGDLLCCAIRDCAWEYRQWLLIASGRVTIIKSWRATRASGVAL